jgi:tRNA-dihydrouridine synthase A
VPLKNLTRHILGLYLGLPGARRWRRTLSDAERLRTAGAHLIVRTAEEIELQSVASAV